MSALSSVEEIIDEARNGRMFILVDDEDRENVGDLVIPAQMATPEKINFMAKHGRGLICLAMTKRRIDELELGPMSRHNATRHETAFTVSIEARDGVSTGISAADRARTVAVAIDASQGREAIVTPGHVFPLVARDGGVLVRTGHTEAAVDVSRLAGLNPSGVICEIMNEDGTMSRMADLVAFAHTHDLKIGTIRDLIAYRLRKDTLVREVARTSFTSRWGGEWTGRSFLNIADGSEQLALVKGEIRAGKPTLVRMHTMSFYTDVFGDITDRAGAVGGAMEMIAAEGSGVLVLLNRTMNGAMARMTALRAGGPTIDSGDLMALRDYGVGAMILHDLGVEDLILLTNAQLTPVALAGYGLNIVGQVAITPAI